MWLLIDDIRDVGSDVIIRNVESAKKILGAMSSSIDFLSIDHDLGIGETGYDILKWALERNCVPDQVQLVTNNPVGRKNMKNLLEDYNYTTVNGIEFFKVKEKIHND